MIKVKTKEEIAVLRKGGAILARILDELSALVAPGVSTEYLNDAALEKMEALGVERSRVVAIR